MGSLAVLFAEFVEKVEGVVRILMLGSAVSMVVSLIVGALIAVWLSRKSGQPTPAPTYGQIAVTSGVWFVRFCSGPAHGMSGKFQVTGGQLVFWGEQAVQPSWAIAATTVGVHATNPVGLSSGNVVLNWQGTDVACLVSRGHSADPRAGLMPGGPANAQAMSFEADSFIGALLVHGATLVDHR